MTLIINPVRHQSPVGTYLAPKSIGPRACVYCVREQDIFVQHASIRAIGIAGTPNEQPTPKNTAYRAATIALPLAKK